MKRRSKRYKSLDVVGAIVEVEEAIGRIRSQKKTAKFDEGIDVAFNLNLLKKHVVRDVVQFPHSFGESPKVAVFAKEKKAEEAKQAGADIVGADDLVERVQKGFLDFKVAIATPDMMKSIAKIARILGTKGLMPNPKAKTVTENVAETVSAIKAGRKEIRADEHGVLHAPIGKLSMTTEQLTENLKALCRSLVKQKPQDVKGEYVKSIFISSTMGRSIALPKKMVGAS